MDYAPPRHHDRLRRRRSPSRDSATAAPPPPPGRPPEPALTTAAAAASSGADTPSVSLARDRTGDDTRASDSGTEAATLSPWTGVGSPASSSDFEALGDGAGASDSDCVLPPAAALSRSRNTAPAPSTQSNLARSLSRRTTQQPRDDPRGASTAPFEAGPVPAASGGGGAVGQWTTAASSMDRSDDDARRAIEGDDEDSSAFEDAGDRDREREREEGRGRARTRRAAVRDPELKRSMLEDALRSSLATLLSLAPAQAGMSQTPSMSHASLASLFQPTASASGPTVTSASAGPSRAGVKRPSPFATALVDPLDEEDDEYEAVAAQSGSVFEDVFASSSSSSSPSSGDDEGTQLAPGPGPPRSHAIPIASSSRSRAYSDSAPPGTAGFSPLVPSRPLGAGHPTSGSPPYYSRSRRGAAPVRRRGERGRGRGGSTSPGPASLEERRRARAAAAAAAAGATFANEAFQELVDAARFFSDLSPRNSLRAPYSSLPSSYETARPRTTTTTTTASSWAPATTASATSTPPFYSDEDPALASESPPVLEGLSSGAEGEGDDRSPPLPGALPVDEKRGIREGEKGGPAPARAADGAAAPAKERQGWFSWLRALGATVEVKVWHLVGLCGVLIGVGIGASSLVRTLAPASWLAARLDFAHHASPFLAPSTPAAVAQSVDRLGSSPTPQGEGMSSLFL